MGITDQNRNEIIQQSELRYEHFFEDNHIPMLLINPRTGNIKNVNSAACKFYGWSKDELLTKNIAQINILSESELQVEMQNAITEKRRHFLFKHRLANGEIRDVEVYSGPIEYENSTFLYSIIHDISERILTEKALSQSENKYSKVFQTSSSGIIITRMDDGKILEVNDAFCFITGFSREEALIDTSVSLKLWAEEADRKYVVEQLRLNSSFSDKEFRFRKKNGEIIYGSMSASVVKIESEVCIFSNITNITERRVAEEKLRISEERYRNIFESVQDAYYEASIEGILLDISPSIKIISKGQFTREELIGKSFINLYADPDARAKFYSNLINYGKVIDYELLMQNKDGLVVPIAISSTLVKDEAGKPSKIIGSLRDITERKQTTKKLEISEERFRKVIEQTSNFISITDNNGYITYVSPSCTTIFQLTQEEMLGAHFLEFVSDADMEKAKHAFTDIYVNNGVVNNAIFCLKRKNNAIFYGELNASKFITGTQNGLLVIISDISERIYAEKVLNEKTSILTHLILNLKEGILLEDSNRKIVLTNQLFCNMFGIPMSAELMIGMDCTHSAEQSKVLFDDPEAFIIGINKILKEKKAVFNDELKLVDGRYFERDFIPTFLKDDYNGHLWKYRDITEKKNAQIELTKISQAVEQSPIMTVVTGIDGIIEYVNPALLKVTGYTKTELIGRNPKILSSGEKSAEEYKTLWKTISFGNEWHGEFHNRKKNGEYYWVSALISPIFDSNAKITHYVSVEEDITERKKIEKELLEFNANLELKVEERTLELNEAKLRLENDISQRILIEKDLRWNKSLLELMSNSSPLGFLVVDNRSDDILYFNHRFCSIWGIEHLEERMYRSELKNNDIIPDCLSQLVDVPAFAESCKPLQFEENRVVIEDEIPFTENRVIRRFSTQIRGENDEYYGRFYIFEDITDRKQSELALLQSEQKYKSVVENINEVIFQTDHDGLWLYLNPAWEIITGFKVDEAIGKLFLNFVHPDDRQRNLDLFKPLMNREKEYCRHEIRYLTHDGGYCWVEVFARISLNEQDEIIGTYGTLQDITERRRAEDFENEMLHLSPQLTGITASEINSALNLALSRIGNFLNADRAYIFEFDATKTHMSNTYEWCNEGIHPEIENLKNIPVDLFPMWIECLNRHENIIIPSVEDLPDTWQAEKEILEPQQIKSLIIMPMLSENTVIGFVGLDSVSEKKTYNEAETNILKIWSSMLTSLINNLRSENLLEQTRQNFEVFFNTIDDFLWVLNDNGNIIHVNNTVKNRLGYTTEELESKSVLMVHPIERQEEAGRIVGEMLEGISEFCPVPILTKDGEQIPVETRVKHGLWNGVPAIFGVSKDISKIQLSEHKFSTAFHSNSALMEISTFEEGQYLDVNNAFLELLDYSIEEVLGKTNLELAIFPDINLRSIIVQSLIADGVVRELEANIRRKNGEIRTVLLSADILYLGNTKCLLTVSVDITERKLAEEEIRNARIEAEHANLAKSEFLSRMSHELRTPMNSILGFAQILEMGELTVGQKKGVNHIMRSGKHLLSLINEVLDLSRIEAGRLSISIEPVEIRSIFLEMIDVIHPLAIDREIIIKLDDSVVNNLFVNADRQSLKQVILNLLNNAVKYNHSGGTVIIKTKLVSQLGADFVRISICDTGVGISEDDIPRLFTPFERIGANKTNIEGTGLGLAVVKKLVEAMGGTLGAKSVLGKGSTFWVELQHVVSQLDNIQNVDLLTTNVESISKRKGTILYIEDNISNIELIEQILAYQRPEVHLISNTNGKQALKLAIEYKPDLILLDLNLPDIHGGEVLKVLSENQKTMNIPIIIISADAMPEQVDKLIKAGAKKYLDKPIDVSALLLAIDEFI